MVAGAGTVEEEPLSGRDDTGVMRSATADEEVVTVGAESSSTMVIGILLLFGAPEWEGPGNGATGTSIGVCW
jgi:hypothetical protein